MFSAQTKDTLAKVAILLWIISLILVAFYIIQVAIVFDINTFFNIPEEHKLPRSIVQEAQVIFLMLAISIFGGLCFMIKDFYLAIKNANLYKMAWDDYISKHIPFEEFQRLIPIEVYTGRFNYTWIYWFLIQPILSSVLGIIAFFIARSGLGVLQGVGSQSDLTIQGLYLYAVLTFLAGFSSHKFIAWLDRLADKIFSATIPDRFEETKTRIQTAGSMDRNELKNTFGLQSEVSESILDSEENGTKSIFTRETISSGENTQMNHQNPEEGTSFEKKPLKSIR